ncbi:hypothetical protein pdam_00003643, partial [Pocillopora damicornis]
MALFYSVKVVYILSLVSFKFALCQDKYSDPSNSRHESCSANDHACKRREIDDGVNEGPTFVGRTGLTRLDGVKLAENNGLLSSSVRGGLTTEKDLEIPKIEHGKAQDVAGIFGAWDINNDQRITVDEVVEFGKKYIYAVFSEEDLMELKLIIIRVITPEEFENMNTRGADTIMAHAGKTHPKYRARYSYQTFLNQRYLKDPTLDRIIERVIKLTKLPREIIYGSERLQVVYYDKNGHYHAHYDSETHLRTDVPCCHQQHEVDMLSFENPCRICRYITILYYLNDVEGGGETAFPVAENETLNFEYLKDSRGTLDYFNLSHNCHVGNLVIKPRKGTAVMWYNHFMDKESGWLGEMDQYSLHGGCDITKGEKWIANNWISAPYKDSAHIRSSLRWKFCLLCSLLALSAYCEKKPSNRTYNVCRFVREGQRCDYKKFDSSGDEPCVIGRKAGLTRINGVKVGHVEDVDLGDIVRKRITKAMRPLLFEIPNFLSEEECGHMVNLAERERFVTSTAKGGLQSWSEFEIPDIRNGPLHVDYFQYLDGDKNGKLTIEEVGFATIDEFKTMNSMGLTDLMSAMSMSHPLHRPRYSDQTWVNQRSLGDPVLNKVIERVIELTRLSREIIYGSERIQIVRYGKHGHYHAHFDSETDKRTDKRCCQLYEDVVQAFNKDEGCRLCRYVTILFYLNDVEEGGETAFPMADNVTLSMEYLTSSRGDLDYFNLSHNCHQGLAISPRKGTAIMWYNHLRDDESGWMGARDDFSLHGGCGIKRGEKWIANLWITAPYKDGAHIPSSWLRKLEKKG